VRSRKLAVASVSIWLGLALASVLPAEIQAQTATVSGTVTDEERGVPLPGVQVVVVGTSRGAMTSETGRYTITGVTPGIITLEARRVGLEPGRTENVRTTANQTTTVDFALRTSVLRLQTVVTTGVVDPVAGVKVPFTVARLSAEDMPVPTTSGPGGAIQGKVAGVQIIRGVGPMADAQIQLRTPTSQFKNTSPMIIVDGLVLSSSFNLTTADINNLDIASMEVIKGAAASSLYGSRAANGVISITTNRGTDIAQGTTQIRTRSELGKNNIANYLRKPQYHHYRINQGEAYVDANGVTVQPLDYVDADLNYVTRTNRVVEPFGQSTLGVSDKPYKDPLYDHARQFWRGAGFMENRITMQQNSQSGNFQIGLLRATEPGILPNNDGLVRHSANVNLDHRLRDNLNLSISANHLRSTEEPQSVIFTDLNRVNPDVNLLTPGPAGQSFPYLIQPDSTETLTNPLYRGWGLENENQRVRTLVNTDLNFSPLHWLSLNGNFGYDRSDRGFYRFEERGRLNNNGETTSTGDMDREQYWTDGFSGTIGGTVLQGIGDLTLRTTVRGLFERERYQGLQASSNNFSSSGVKRLQAGANISAINTDTDTRALSGLISTALDYNSKYVADVLYRYDGNSRFGPTERWHSYYRLAGAYRMAEEPWWPFENVNEFKLRYSRGTGGTRPDFLDQYETLQLEQGGGIIRRILGNPLLRPEVSTEQEVGLEMIFNNRVSVQLVQVWNFSEDNIIGVAVPALSGYNTQELNAGAIRANTFEVTVQAEILRRGNFRWETNIVGDRSRHRVVEFDRPCYGDGLLLRCNNEILGVMRGSRFVEHTGELLAPARARADEFMYNDEGYLVWVGAGNTFEEGVSKNLWGTSTSIDGLSYLWGRPITFRDTITGFIAEEEIIGNSNPWGNFGVGNTVRWGDVTVYALLTGQFGGSIYNDARQQLHRSTDHPDLDQFGKPEGLKKSRDYYVNGLYHGNRWTKNYVEEATYAKISQASITYRVPNTLLGRLPTLGLSAVRVEGIARNLATFSKYSGYDPERGTALRRVDSLGYPRYRTFTGVVHLTF
jgi:TonB-linked SusC/RagA family outer membrane protein